MNSRLPPNFSGRSIIRDSFLSESSVKVIVFRKAIVPLSGFPSSKSADFIFFWIVFASSSNPIFEASTDADIFFPIRPGMNGIISSTLFL